MLRSALLLLCAAALALGAAPRAQGAGLRPAKTALTGVTGRVAAGRNARGDLAVAAVTRRGIMLVRARAGRRFGAPVRLARPRAADLGELQVAVGPDGGVLMVWTTDDGSYESDPYARDEGSCCYRVEAAGLTAGGRRWRARRLSRPGVTATLGALEVHPGGATVTAALALGIDDEAEHLAAWQRRGGRWRPAAESERRWGWTAPQVLSGRGRRLRVWAGSSLDTGRRASARSWRPFGGSRRSRPTVSWSDAAELVQLVRAGRTLAALLDDGWRHGYRERPALVVATPGRRPRRSVLGGAVDLVLGASDDRGRLSVITANGRRGALRTRTWSRRSGTGRWHRLGRLGSRASDAGTDQLRATRSADGRVSLWAIPDRPGEVRLLLRSRTAGGRLRASSLGLQVLDRLGDVTTDRRGRPLALLVHLGRVWTVRP